MAEYLVLALVLLGVLIAGTVGLVVPRLRRRPEPPLPRTEVDTRAEEDLAGPPVEAPESDLSTGVLVEPPPVLEPQVEVPEPTAGRLVRLRSRLSRSQNVFGKGLLGLLARDHLDEDVWEEIEDSLITADVGVDATRDIVDRLRERTRVLGTRSASELRALLAAELVNALDPSLDRSSADRPEGRRAGGGPGRRRQRRRQDHHLRQDRPGAGRRRSQRAARRGRHLPGRRRRPAGDLGLRGSARRPSGGPRPPTRPASPSTPSSAASTPAWTPCSSTPPAACRTRSA